MEDDDGLMVGGELVLSGFVGETFWDDGFTYAQVIRALAAASGPVTVRLNSGGGYATEGHAIYSALANHPEEVTIRVEGIAASAASLIAMAGDVIEMTPGALMMIHDPAGVTFGDAAEHERRAAVLDTMGDSYARVYAERSGKSPDEARAIMRAETWFTSAEAVEAGFATREGSAPGDEDAEDAVAAFDFSIYAQAPAHLQGLSEAKGWRFQPKAGAGPARSKEPTMSVEPTAGGKAPATKTSAAPDDEALAAARDEAAKAAVKAERERVSGIRSLLSKAPLKPEAKAAMETKLVDGDATLEAARDALLDALCAQDEVAPTSGHRPTARITRDEDETRFEGMANALSATLFRTRLEGPGEAYRGITPKRLAIELAGPDRLRHNDAELVKRGMGASGVLMAAGMHSTSDFTYLTTEVVNRALRAQYESRPGTWRRISRERSAADFRSLTSVQAGVDAMLKKVNEAGEYEATVASDTGETYRVVRYGRELHVTFETVVNDDMGAISRLPLDFARGCLNLESRIAWGLIVANGAMSDGTALFAAGRNNLAGSGAAISVATVGAARKAMWEQRPHGAKEGGDDFIEATPDLLYVPPALEVKALQFVGDITPTKGSDTNPYRSTLDVTTEPRLGAAAGGSETAWFLFDSSLPVLEHAFLSGYEAPMIEAEDKTNPRGITMTVEHMFGVGAVEFRGGYKNNGA